jgi:hypothetical protein
VRCGGVGWGGGGGGGGGGGARSIELVRGCSGSAQIRLLENLFSIIKPRPCAHPHAHALPVYTRILRSPIYHVTRPPTHPTTHPLRDSTLQDEEFCVRWKQHARRVAHNKGSDWSRAQDSHTRNHHLRQRPSSVWPRCNRPTKRLSLTRGHCCSGRS